MLILVVALFGLMLVPFVFLLSPLVLWFNVPFAVILTVVYAVKVVTKWRARPVAPHATSL
jgi:predicted signal transduction protein with EAL and GGDEF domain